MVDYLGPIQFRRGTTAEWAASNPVLAEGEMGVDLTARRARIGDGVSSWSALPWVNLDPATVTALESAAASASAAASDAATSAASAGTAAATASTKATQAASSATAAQAAQTAAEAVPTSNDGIVADLINASSSDTKTALSAAFVQLLPAVGTLTYDSSGNVTQDQDGTTYTYNSDGTVHTITRGSVTRTLAYNSDGTIASVA